ncbi:hypothetical protein, partial [Thorsellia anophelis]|uniref:hypothetical protein n=1 Tax=Thorsellia anophelis TaxID=336804 RepID=UPI001C42F14F
MILYMHKKISFQPDTEPSFTTDSFRASGGTCQESFTYDANLNLIAQHIQPTTMAGQNTDSIKIQNIQLTGRTIKNGDNWFKYDNQGRLIEKRVVENGFRP